MRHRALDEMISYFNQEVSEMDIKHEYKMKLLGMITAIGYKNKEQEQHWILCSERLPEEKDAGILKKLGIQKQSDSVIVTLDIEGERMTDLDCTYDGVWQWKMKYAFPDYKTIAWMPLPEPYQEGEHDSQ